MIFCQYITYKYQVIQNKVVVLANAIFNMNFLDLYTSHLSVHHLIMVHLGITKFVWFFFFYIIFYKKFLPSLFLSSATHPNPLSTPPPPYLLPPSQFLLRPPPTPSLTLRPPAKLNISVTVFEGSSSVLISPTALTSLTIYIFNPVSLLYI